MTSTSCAPWQKCLSLQLIINKIQHTSTIAPSQYSSTPQFLHNTNKQHFHLHTSHHQNHILYPQNQITVQLQIKIPRINKNSSLLQEVCNLQIIKVERYSTIIILRPVYTQGNFKSRNPLYKIFKK
jgi:hypothetical protein